MKNLTPENIEAILENQICGFHLYDLEPYPRLRYVSRNLCDLLDCTAESLQNEGEDPYAKYIHPDDRAAYSRFLIRLGREAQTLNITYRLLCRCGIR